MKHSDELLNIFDKKVFEYLPQSTQASWTTFLNYETSNYFNKKRSFYNHPNSKDDINTEELNFYQQTKTILCKDIDYTLEKLINLKKKEKNKRLIGKYTNTYNSLLKSYGQIKSLLNNHIKQSSLNKINRLGVYDKKVLQLSENDRKDLIIESFFSNTEYISLLKSNVIKIIILAIIFLITVLCSKI